ATGIDWTFAPTVAVVRDDRWGRTYEGYSEDPQIVRSYAGAMIRGLQGDAGSASFLNSSHISATAKHFIGDGGTYLGIDRGDNCASEQQLLTIHAQGYIAAIEAGVQTVMVSYNSWQGAKLHGQKHLITDVLKGRLGFDGVVVSDWDGIDEVQGCSKDKCAKAIDAGIDLFMVPQAWKGFIQNTVEQVRAGDIPEARIDDAVTRILRIKMRAGLFEKGRPSSRPLANHRELIGAQEHRAVAREAVRKSLVLLKNDKRLLPLARRTNVLVAGDGANSIGRQSGGWTISWQGTGNSNQDFPGGTSIYEGIRASVEASAGTATLSVDGSYRAKPDVAIVVFGEHPYAEWHGDIPSVDHPRTLSAASDKELLRPAPEAGARGASCEKQTASSAPKQPIPVIDPKSDANLSLLRSLKERGIPVVAVFLTGRPLWIAPELEASDAFVVAWLPGTEGGGIADVLFRRKDGQVDYGFTGKLSYSWPGDRTGNTLNRNDPDYHPLFAYGFGLTY
ncbi:MAG TPA: glycoside hydrolase family 3 N-terminal domain-containing protein, partial [Steroidobacteraceae bacterium]|nr:glycoside hydrolase family 3 N-terminal domain-containing protein [Steroidobacteraceae bacterium]